jgi:hypothetical protein
MADVLEFEKIHDEDGALRADFVRAVADALEQEEPRELRGLCATCMRQTLPT